MPTKQPDSNRILPEQIRDLMLEIPIKRLGHCENCAYYRYGKFQLNVSEERLGRRRLLSAEAL